MDIYEERELEFFNSLPEEINNFFKIFENHNMNIFIVGGAIRNFILKKQVKDYDVIVECKYICNVISDILIPNNIKHCMIRNDDKNLVKIILDNNIELDLCLIRNNILEDLDARDFTINTLVADVNNKVVFDYFGILNDDFEFFDNTRLTCVTPYSIEDDPIRLLRAVRFSLESNLQFSKLLEKTIEEFDLNKLKSMPVERITQELKKTFLNCNNIDLVIKMYKKYGILEVLFPDVCELQGIYQGSKWHPEGDVYNHTLECVKNINPDNKAFELVMAVLLHDIGKVSTGVLQEDDHVSFKGHEEVGAEMAQWICEEFKLSNDETECIVWCIRNHMKMHHFFELKRSKKIRLVTNKYYNVLSELNRCDNLGSWRTLENPEKIEEWISQNPIVELRQKLNNRLITGDDLINNFKLKPGPLFKLILEYVEDKQLNEEISTREEGLNEVSNFLTCMYP